MQKVDIKPMTANKCWQGRRFKTVKYKDWRDQVGYLIKNDKKFTGGKYELLIHVYTKYSSTSDVDNFIKPIMDCLVDVGIIEDDRFIQKVTCEKFKSAENYFEYELKEYV